VADCYLVEPDGRHPAVLLFMDAIGLRPRLEEMADRIAAEGYVVLVPNLFHRSGRAPVIPDLVARLSSEDRATVLSELAPHMRALTPDAAARDTEAYVTFLEQQPSVVQGVLGTTGYCMGGALALRAAAQLPDTVRAAASFHGGNLAPDDPHGVHALAPRIKAEVYVAHADNDRSMPAEQIARLDEALRAAGTTFTAEVYEGAVHGFTMSDMPVHDAAAEQRHWDALLDLFRRNLSGGA
jgi:carboxymethylenebutenolidase